jgi:hypothetical protein
MQRGGVSRYASSYQWHLLHRRSYVQGVHRCSTCELSAETRADPVRWQPYVLHRCMHSCAPTHHACRRCATAS